ncbi:hypothetical protein HGG73_12640 [Rhodobacteraceae bacterium R_SAG3]|nr:hypothetical protein [Rhodobacteraceae bacterium R_SAG3]
MSHNIHALNPSDSGVDAAELAGLALAMRIVVTDYLSDRHLSKCNALDALASILHTRTEAHVQVITSKGKF